MLRISPPEGAFVDPDLASYPVNAYDNLSQIICLQFIQQSTVAYFKKLGCVSSISVCLIQCASYQRLFKYSRINFD